MHFRFSVRSLLAAGSIVVCSLGLLRAVPVDPAGEKLTQALNALDVEHHWIAGHAVDWQTGEPVPTSGQHATHCSAFAAAAAEKLGVYLLRPPEHSEYYLASAQQDWLETQGAFKGWKPVADPVEAQTLANRGWLVVVTYKSPIPKKPGHIAIVRPADLSPEAIREKGPEETQAGKHNYNATVVSTGFAAHPGAFARGQLRYFAHPLP